MEANDYFQSFEEYFWHWEDAGEIIAMPSGLTVAYKDYVVEVLGHLQSQGLPPYGSLLLAIIATNPNASNAFEQGFPLMAVRLKSKEVNTATLAQMERALPFLKILSQVPNEYKQGIKRVQLFQTLFLGCHNGVSPGKAAKLLAWYRQATGQVRFLEKMPFNPSVFYKDFKTIFLLGEKYPTVDSILKKMAGMPDAPVEISLPDEDVPEAAPKDFVEELMANSSTFHVGALVKRIWSGLNIPFHNVLPSEQPLGGVSDISNKGEFDKLLISEFAHDDLTFMSRLANNEALYINREVPPASNPLQRIILIDVSLKNWGIPKTMAYAIMLAIAKHPKTDIECSAFVLGDAYYPILFENIHTLIDSLQRLDGGLDCAPGLEAFLKDYGRTKNIELVFISAFDALKSPRLQKLMADHHGRFKYWIHTDSAGNLSLYRNQHASKRHLQDMRLPLDELWAKKPKFRPAGPSKSDEKPTLFSDYPILFPFVSDNKIFLSTDDGEWFRITAEKTVMRFYDKNAEPRAKGWETIYEKLPSNQGHYQIGRLDSGVYILLLFDPQTKNIHFVNLTEKTTQSVSFNSWKSNGSPGFFFYQNRFYYLTRSAYWVMTYGAQVEIEKHEEEAKHLFDEYNKKATRSVPFYERTGHNVQKSVKRIFIHSNGNLVVNVRELAHTGGGIRFGMAGSQVVEMEAIPNHVRRVFTFADGSTVTIKRTGMMVLKSSDATLPEIYIPLVVDSLLGVATRHECAGNSYFLKEATSDVVLLEPGANRLAVVKTIKDLTGLGLGESRDIMEANGSFVGKAVKQASAEKWKRQLEGSGGKVQLVPVSTDGIPAMPTRIDTKDFFDRYIQSFTFHIRNHGTEN